MATYQIAYNPMTRVALIQGNGSTVPPGSVDIGEFELEPTDNTVFFHHVRDALYHRKPDGALGFWPENETDMQRISIYAEGSPDPEPTPDPDPDDNGDDEEGE